MQSRRAAPPTPPHSTTVTTADSSNMESLARSLDAAEQGYVERGWPVFHLLPRSKEPFPGSRGFYDATLDAASIQASRQRYPRANIGIATGIVSGLYVVDLDTAKGGLSTWARLEARYGSAVTLEAETGSGGAHLLFAYPDDDDWPNTCGRLGQGIDTRGQGGYIMAAPSIHPNGRPYRWCDATTDPAPMPGWLLDLLVDEPPPPRVLASIVPDGPRRDAYWLAALRGEVDQLLNHPEKVKGGQGRNWRLHLAACRLGRLEAHGADLQVAEDALVEAARSRGVREADARRQVRNGFAWGRSHPRAGGAA
jgi:hypothetical protein